MLESIEKLRELRSAVETNDVDNPIWVCHKAVIIADEIEREIAERYMPLPLDADGVPIHVGDELQDANGVKVIAECVDHDGFCAIGTYRNGWCNYRHVKPRTAEDVLRELLDEPFKWNTVTGKYEADNEYNEKKLRRYADVLRNMFVGELPGGDAE